MEGETATLREVGIYSNTRAHEVALVSMIAIIGKCDI